MHAVVVTAVEASREREVGVTAQQHRAIREQRDDIVGDRRWRLTNGVVARLGTRARHPNRRDYRVHSATAVIATFILCYTRLELQSVAKWPSR